MKRYESMFDIELSMIEVMNDDDDVVVVVVVAVVVIINWLILSEMNESIGNQ